MATPLRGIPAPTTPFIQGGTELIIPYSYRKLYHFDSTGAEFSLVGKNLLENHHLETVSDLTLIRHEVESSVHGQVSWAF